ncbi:MAG: shikimate kinase [Acidimicrobiales bacterium]|nr:shikimate kinase [Acidimicrobiales bacterium]
MGSGKTTVGRRVAKLLGRPFADADAALEARTGRTVREWFDQDGEAGFRAAEADTMAALLDAAAPAVIASGGGAVVTPATRALLAAPSVFVVWLWAEPEFLASRVAQKAHRPLLDGDADEVLPRLAAERASQYAEVADLTLDIRPAHEADAEPKWNLAQQIVAAVTAREAGGDPAAAARSVRNGQPLDAEGLPLGSIADGHAPSDAAAAAADGAAATSEAVR